VNDKTNKMDFVQRIIKVAELECILAKELRLTEATQFLKEHISHEKDKYSLNFEYDSEKRLVAIAITNDCYDNPELKRRGSEGCSVGYCIVYSRE
jgi:hypothetical protein